MIRAQDPEAIVISGGFTGMDGLAFIHGRTPPSVKYYNAGGGPPLGYCDQDPAQSPGPNYSFTRQELLDAGAFQNLDAMVQYIVPLIAPFVDRFDYHHYKGDARWEEPIIQEMNARLAGAGASQPLMSIENAGPFFFYSIGRQASELVKRYLFFIEGGGTRLFWSSMNPTVEFNLNFQNLSLLDCNSNPKVHPYYAYRELTRRVPLGATLTRHVVSSSPPAVVFEVNPNDGTDPAVFAWEFDGNAASIIPADIPTFAGTGRVRIAYMASATQAGLPFTLADATQTVSIGYDVLVLHAARAGDLDGDGNVDLNDFITFAGCFSGAEATTPPAGCDPADFATADLDGDSDVDLNDFTTFAANFTG